MYIIYLWIAWILLGFVIQQGMHVVKKDLRFDITDHASNQVKPCVPKPKFHVQDVLTFIFFLFPHSQILMSVNSLSLSCSVSTTCQTTPEYRHAPRGIFGSRATSNVVSLQDRVTRLRMNSRIFKLILHVVQVSLFQGKVCQRQS